MTPKATANKRDHTELEGFCTAKEPVDNMKRQPTKWEETFPNHKSDQALVLKTHKELIQLNSKTMTTQLTNRHLPKGDTQAAGRPRSRCPTSLLSRENQNQTAGVRTQVSTADTKTPRDKGSTPALRVGVQPGGHSMPSSIIKARAAVLVPSKANEDTNSKRHISPPPHSLQHYFQQPAARWGGGSQCPSPGTEGHARGASLGRGERPGRLQIARWTRRALC